MAVFSIDIYAIARCRSYQLLSFYYFVPFRSNSELHQYSLALDSVICDKISLYSTISIQIYTNIIDKNTLVIFYAHHPLKKIWIDSEAEVENLQISTSSDCIQREKRVYRKMA